MHVRKQDYEAVTKFSFIRQLEKLARNKNISNEEISRIRLICLLYRIETCMKNYYSTLKHIIIYNPKNFPSVKESDIKRHYVKDVQDILDGYKKGIR